MKPLVSAIIPNHNYAKYVVEAVESVLNQSYTNLEVIVVDDGSTDQSLEILQVFGERIVVISQKNAGVSAARNAGVVASSGEYIAFLDADDIWECEKIERQVAVFSGGGFGIVHVGVTDINGDGEPLGQHLNGLDGEVADELLKWERPVILGGGSGAMVTRKAFDESGGFDTELMTSADWDFYYRVCRKHRTAFIAEPLLRYRIHGDNMHANVDRMEREMTRFYNKAFAEPGIDHLRRRAFGNFHRVLAGSYFHAGDYGKFISHAGKSIWMRPANASYFFSFPLRRIKRKSGTDSVR
jgi:glycosyltransferase involved in cell wall biosynthesis